MAKSSGLGQRMYVHGFDISGDVSAINTWSTPSEVLPATGIDKSAHERMYGRQDGLLDFASYFNDATDQEHDALKGLVKTDRLLMWLLGTTRGDPVACLFGKQMNYDFDRPASGALLATVQAKANGFAGEWADLLVAKVTHSSNGATETGIDGTAQSTAGGVGFLQHFSASAGTVEYDIDDSSDSTNGVDGSWATLLSFSDVSTPWAATAERVAVSGTVERWVRALTEGTFTAAVFAMAFKRN